MKKFLTLLVIFLIGSSSFADVIEVERVTDMSHFWEQTGKYEQKVLDVGTKILNANKIDKRIAFQTYRNHKIINAETYRSNKLVVVYYGLLMYMDNDDELASVLGHEMGHALDDYGGFFKWMDMTLNSKAYEFKADLIGIDLMAKAGYNPVAAICAANKWMPEEYWDFGVFTTHPKTSRRLMEMYKYIYRKYPWALNTEMVHNVNYENFTYSSKKEIAIFQQEEKKRADDQHRGEL